MDKTEFRDVFVGNLPIHRTESDVRRLFASYEPILFVKLMTNSVELTKYAFIKFERLESAEAAIREMNGYSYSGINGPRLKVKWSNSPPSSFRHGPRNNEVKTKREAGGNAASLLLSTLKVEKQRPSRGGQGRGRRKESKSAAKKDGKEVRESKLEINGLEMEEIKSESDSVEEQISKLFILRREISKLKKRSEINEGWSSYVDFLRSGFRLAKDCDTEKVRKAEEFLITCRNMRANVPDSDESMVEVMDMSLNGAAQGLSLQITEYLSRIDPDKLEEYHRSVGGYLARIYEKFPEIEKDCFDDKDVDECFVSEEVKPEQPFDTNEEISSALSKLSQGLRDISEALLDETIENFEIPKLRVLAFEARKKAEAELTRIQDSEMPESEKLSRKLIPLLISLESRLEKSRNSYLEVHKLGVEIEKEFEDVEVIGSLSAVL